MRLVLGLIGALLLAWGLVILLVFGKYTNLGLAVAAFGLVFGIFGVAFASRRT